MVIKNYLEYKEEVKDLMTRVGLVGKNLALQIATGGEYLSRQFDDSPQDSKKSYEEKQKNIGGIVCENLKDIGKTIERIQEEKILKTKQLKH